MTNLDMSALPSATIYNNDTPAGVSLEKTVRDMRPAIEQMMADGIVAQRDSFGYALARPATNYTRHWNNPDTLIGLVVWWGSEGPRYAANACRKIRASARLGKDTESIRIHQPEKFRDVIESVDDDGNFRGGDFPYDGATFVKVQDRLLLGAVSAYPKEQDPLVSRLVTGHIGLVMFESDKRLAELTSA